MQTEVLAQRGNGVITQSAFAARVAKIPRDQRQQALRDQSRLQDMINVMLINAQLAADARATGFDDEQIVVDRMKLAAESELAAAWLDHYVQSQPAADYELLAREYYLVNQDKMMSPAKFDASHILITTQERDDEDAKALADSLYDQLIENPSKFDQFVIEYSEDPKARSNKGRYTSIGPGEMVKAFEETALALKEGEISPPIKSSFGYHIIRLDAHIAPSQRSFDEVKAQLIERQRKMHEDRLKRDYLGTLTSLDVEMTKEALDEMFRSQFGDEIFESPGNTPETE
ncbi:MAG: peptidylprolyl isomerase [Xanthomonadales bacterium]|nr:peptidylprolyl isomerase [Xanthomonadales bacterium]